MKWTSKFGADLGPPSQSLYFTRDDWIFFFTCRYYKTKGVLPPTWKYESSTASALVS